MAETLQFPDTLSFTTTLPVRITDINYGNHVGNDAVLGLLHEARLRFLAEFGFSELDAGGAGLIMRDVVVQYKRQMKYGDSVEVSVAAVEAGRAGFDLFYRMQLEEQVAVEARTGMLFFDYERERPARMPEAFKAVLTQ